MDIKVDLDKGPYSYHIAYNQEVEATFELKPDSKEAQSLFKELGKGIYERTVEMTRFKPHMSLHTRIIRRVLQFAYGWLGYRPPKDATLDFSFKTNSITTTMEDGRLTVEMRGIRDLIAGVK
jgi:hypothetical protein